MGACLYSVVLLIGLAIALGSPTLGFSFIALASLVFIIYQKRTGNYGNLRPTPRVVDQMKERPVPLSAPSTAPAQTLPADGLAAFIDVETNWPQRPQR